MAMLRLLMFLTVAVFSVLANHASVNNGQIIYAFPPPPPPSLPCETCATCENPCTPAAPASPPPPAASPPPPAASLPPPGAAQNAECPPPPKTYVYPYSPPAPVTPGSRFPYYPFYTISRSAPLVNPLLPLFFLLSPFILILTL